MFKNILNATACVLLLYINNAQAISPQAQADMLMLEIKSDMDANHWNSAISKFTQVGKLKAKTPETFDYHWAITLANAGYWRDVAPHLEKYLDKTGSNGKFYKEALELYTRTKSMVISKSEYDSIANIVANTLGIYIVMDVDGRRAKGSSTGVNPKIENGSLLLNGMKKLRKKGDEFNVYCEVPLASTTIHISEGIKFTPDAGTSNFKCQQVIYGMDRNIEVIDLNTIELDQELSGDRRKDLQIAFEKLKAFLNK